MRRIVIAIVLLTAGGLALLAWQPAGLPVRGGAVRSALPEPGVAGTTNSRTTQPDPVVSSDALSARHKYRFLLEELGPRNARVLGLLVRREALVTPPGLGPEPSAPDAAHAAELAKIERALRHELSPAAYSSYELFRDSDVEQYQLDEFTGGLREFAALDRGQERAVLEAKLRQRQLYLQFVQTAGLERQGLSLDEREYALATVETGLSTYRAAYLDEVAPVLDERQYTALSNFEATEFRLELERLQQAINAR